MNKKALSFVELIISISIITLISVIGMSYFSDYNNNKFNTKIQADLESLNNSLLSYKQENGEFPLPGGNKNYYKEDTSYSHNENGAYGVHGFITNNLIAKKYLNYLPLDPRTNQFYAYGKTIDNNNFEVAGVIYKDGEYITQIKGNYSGNKLVGLIREYNGPQFLYNNTTEHFPYNPESRILTAKIGTYTGSINIITSNGRTINTNIIYQTLTNGDTIKTGNNSEATIYFSDGSVSQLKQNSTLKITSMDYSSKENEYNLITKVKLFLEQGTIWTKASRLNKDGSEFEISTQDATAAVRGTIFGVQRKNGQTNIKLVIGKIDILKNDGTFIKTLEVNPGESAKNVSIKNGTEITSTTINSNFKIFIFPSNFKLEVKSIKNGASGKIIEFNNSFNKGKLYVNNTPKNCNFFTNLTNCNIGNITSNNSIYFCKTISPEYNQSCTQEIQIGNLVYNKLQEKIPIDNNLENKINLSANPTTPTDNPHSSEDSGNHENSEPSYTPCNGSYTPGCIITISGHKLQLTGGPYSGNGCGGICGGGNKTGHGFLHNFFGFNNKKYCKNIISINGNNVLCAKKKWGRKNHFWPEYTWFNENWSNGYIHTKIH